MIFSKALLAKGLGGLAMVGTGSLGILSTKLYLDNKVTRFDQGLIDFLDADNTTDIEFVVKKVTSSAEEELNSTFPSFTNGQSSNQTDTVSIKVSIDTSNTGDTDKATKGKLIEKNDLEKGTKTYLQKLNGDGAAWTWICELKFVREGDSGTELKDKTTLLNSTEPKGFFDKLKEKKTENKPLKKQFIRNCAGERGFKKNWEISGAYSLTDNNEIKSTKEFKLVKGETIGKSSDTDKLFPVNEAEFNSWFKIT